MHHGIADLDPSGEAIGQNAACFALKDRQERAGLCQIAVIHMQRAGQLPLKAEGNFAHLFKITGAHNHPHWAKHLVTKRVIGQPICTAHLVEIGGCIAVVAHGSQNLTHRVLGADGFDPIAIGLGNACG